MEEEKQYQKKRRDPEKNKKGCKKYRQTSKGKFQEYKRNARRRNNIEFCLTKKEFMTFWQKSCYYCGDKIKTIGIDRLDSKKGYSLDNIIPCCGQCNKMKMGMTKKEFMSQCVKIAKKHFYEKTYS